MEDLSDNDSTSLPETGLTTTNSPIGGATGREAVTPDVEHAEAAAAAAEVALIAPTGGGRGRDPTGDQALMGASNDEGNVDGFEATDESGEMVQTAMLQFLQV